jgi:hypothetical protein
MSIHSVTAANGGLLEQGETHGMAEVTRFGKERKRNFPRDKAAISCPFLFRFPISLFFFQRSSRALTDIHGGVVPVDRRRDARRHLPAMGIWDAADLRPVVGPVVVVVTVVGVGPLGHETTACSVGWWLMAGAGLF